MVSVYDEIMSELQERKTYMSDIYAPPYICSFGIHAFNLMNQGRKVYYVGKQLPNMRAHLLFISPSGFMKTHYGDVMIRDPNAIFKGTCIESCAEQTVSEAGFVGTVASVNGLKTINPGSAELNMNSIMFVDEFKGITEAMKAQFNSQMETQMLAALDHGNVFKRLGAGNIAYQTFLTLWTGVQPGNYDLHGGLGRRFIVMIFTPTREDSDQIMDIMHYTQNMRPDLNRVKALWEKIDICVKKMDEIETIELADDTLKYYHNIGAFSFEKSNFDRIIFGYHLMKHGPEKHMSLDLADKELRNILERQKMWRDSVYEGLEYLQIKKVLMMHGGTAKRMDIVKECSMVGWNAKQALSILGEMRQFKIVKVDGELVTLKMKEDKDDSIPEPPKC